MRIFSGIQPTGIPHLGNYIGALRNWVKLQCGTELQSVIPLSGSGSVSKESVVAASNSQPEILYSIVDLHSVTVPHEPDILRENIFIMAAALLACGVDPKRSILFQQSQVPQHCELAWLLGCITSTNYLGRMHQWKSKSSEEKDRSMLGLFSYPVLMAADILLYRASHVPVGHDQLQHLELTRDIAVRFNKKFATDLVIPQPIITAGARIMNLRKPEHKMSKSDSNLSSRIEITDSPDIIRKKIAKAVTDSEPFISSNLSIRPGVRNLVEMYASLSGMSADKVVEQYLEKKYFTKQLKEDLTDVVVEHLSPIRTDYLRYIEEKAYLRNVLDSGAEKAKMLAAETMSFVRQCVGFS